MRGLRGAEGSARAKVPRFRPTIERDGRAATTVFDQSSKVSMCGRREAQHKTLEATIESAPARECDRRRGERKNPPLRARYESSTME